MRRAEREQDVLLELPHLLGDATVVGSKPFTSAATRTGNADASNVWIQSTPLRPASALSHDVATSLPIGVTAPSPVTATLLTNVSVSTGSDRTAPGSHTGMSVAAQASKPGLVFFHSDLSGNCRRVEGFLAQVLQRRHNHATFKLYRVEHDERPDLAERFGVVELPTLVIVESKKVPGEAREAARLPRNRVVPLALAPLRLRGRRRP